MKRLIAAAALFSVIIIICIISRLTVHGSVKAAKNAVYECERLFLEKRFTEAAAATEAFKNGFKKESEMISLFADHNNLDDINMLAASMLEAAKEKDGFQFYSAASRISFALDMIYKEHSFTLENLY
ncbi:MAG: DUF4363 family protein [Clostridia bacterium]|nr:DUF4363 family protein [Clostridia bacterium]